MLTGSRTKQIGRWGETQACHFLLRSGFSVVERNYQVPAGEIDIIARTPEGDYYFIEVKTHQAGALGNDTAITPFKKLKMQKTLRRYCYERQVGAAESLVTAGLLVIVNRAKSSVKFRLAVYC